MQKDASKPYVHGYGAASSHMASRTAEVFADFFMPHLKPGQDLLDLGCGPGSITAGLAAVVSPGKVTGLDISEGEISRAEELKRESGLENLRFVTGDALDLPFEDGAFDAVFSCAMVEHVPDKEAALAEIKRVIKPGGLIGLVGGVFDGHLQGPEKPWTGRAMEIFFALVDNTDMDGNFGLKQRPMLRSLGFTDLQQFPWYMDAGGNPMGYNRRFRSDEMINQVEALGISTREEMIELANEMDESFKDPDIYAYFA